MSLLSSRGGIFARKMYLSSVAIILLYSIITLFGAIHAQVPAQQQQQQHHQQGQQQQQQQYQQQQPPQGQQQQQQQQYQQQPPPQHQQQQQYQQQHPPQGQVPQHIQQQQQKMASMTPEQRARAAAEAEAQAAAEARKFAANNEVHDTSHIQEHLDGQAEIDTSKMTNEQLQFHYFTMHDLDKDNKLDGLELIKAITHWHGDDAAQAPPKIEDGELEEMIDSILKDDDYNNDGYVDYPEFLRSQAGRQAEAAPAPPPPAQ